MESPFINNVFLRSFQGETDYRLLANILTASENADSLPITFTAEALADLLRQTPRLNLRRDLVIAEVDGEAVGYGNARWWEDSENRNYGLSGFVHPDWRRKGIGRVILGWLETRVNELNKENATTLPGCLYINATQYQTGVHSLACQAGYRVKESWALMVRPNLDDIPELPLPEGLEVRPVKPEHYSAIWYAVEEAYEPEGGPPPTGVFPPDELNSPNFQPELWQAAWEISSNKVVGSVMTYINHAENEGLGILRGFTEGISTTPAWQRRGVARALIFRSLKIQREAGMKESAMVCSGEKPNNNRLYESCGFKEVKRDTVYGKKR